MTYGFQIISPRLFHSFVCVDAGIASGSCQVFSLSVGDVLAIRVAVALCKAEINNIDVVLGHVIPTDQKVIRLDISMYYSLLVDLFNPFDLETIRCHLMRDSYHLNTNQ